MGRWCPLTANDRMSSSLLLRLVVVILASLATEVRLISGLELEESGGPFEERVSSSGRSSYPQIYNLYLEPVRKGSSFDLIQPEKRSRLFVGKRFSDDYLSDDEDLLPLSSEDNDEPLYVKSRSHLFVGRRASPRFVGKRMARKKRFASNEYGRDENMEDSDEGRMWKLWMTPGSGEVGNTVADKRSRLFVGDKRSRLFVGKRRELEADDKKRSRLFVGRRAEAEEKRDSGIALPAEVELSEADKRSRLFVGKRHPGDQPSSHSSERFGTEKEPDEMPSSPRAAGESTDDKRVHLFPGKRPAPGFVGKREE